jgi:hypothetical protein
MPVFVPAPAPRVEIDPWPSPGPKIEWPVGPPAEPSPPGLWKVAVPVLGVVAALGSAAPVLAALLLALLVLPAVATVGDAMTFVRVRREGARMRWVHRVALPGLLPVRFVRNLAGVLYAVGPALVLAGVVVAVTLLLDAADVSLRTQEIVLRPGGVAAALLLTVPVLRNRRRFRAAVVADTVVAQCVDPEGRLTQPGIVLWVAASLVTLAGFGFRPELWPLGA